MTEQEDVLPHSDGGHTELIGNHPALDVVNTVAWRLDPERAVDRIPDGAGLLRWATFAGMVDQAGATGRAEAADLAAARVRELRELLHQVLQPLAVGHSPAAGALTDLRSRVLDALGHPEVEIAKVMPLTWSVPGRTVVDLPARLAVEAWDLLVHEDVRRLRQCRDDDCGWLFLDRSRNGSRVWCSSADCGNRSRARRHYRRHRGDASLETP
jgi:predicted RNA-binding Zn ribbon-like protein